MKSQSGTRMKFLAAKPVEQLSDSEWQALGFSNPVAVKAGLNALRQRPALARMLADHSAVVVGSLAKSCDPDKAFFGLQRWLEAGAGAAVPAWHEQAFLELLCCLFAATPALSEYFIRFPQRTGPVLAPVLCQSPGLRRPRLALPPEAAAYTEQLAFLRRSRLEHILRIAALDLQGRLPLADTVRALSDLADASLGLALDIAARQLQPRLGSLPVASGVLPFAVLALGKLGGRELNYSSDIDLVFVCSGSGETAGTARPVDCEKYFAALAEELIAALDKVTEDGRAYRVDVRLRPHGDAGPLVSSVDAMLNYFQAEGRTWERQAWLKARTVAGDTVLGQQLLDGLAFFIFRRYLSLDAIGDLQALKRQMELGTSRRGENEDEVKLGRGGIRDIEFVVQFLQLSHGGEHPRVRTGNTLYALYQLRREGLLAVAEAEFLAQAYMFLRNVEHRLQLHGDQQVHRLPAELAARRRIALSLRYADTGGDAGAPKPAQDVFEEDRARYTARTREIFERLFANLFRENTGPEAELSDLLLEPEPDVPRLAGLLRSFGFAAADSSARELLELAHPNQIFSTASRTRKFFASVAPALAKALAATGEPDAALRRFSRLAGSLGAKAVFYQMLNENSWLLKMTVDLAAWSEFLTAILVANPGLFDELVDALQTARAKTLRQMLDEMAQLTGGGDIADTLRAYRAGETLRIGVRDLIHSASLEQTQGELSDLAEVVLGTQLQDCSKQQRDRRGIVRPSLAAAGAQGNGVGFAVLAVGKFGGREMNYGSDLDVLFFYGEEGQTDAGLPAGVYFTELAQELSRAMASPTALGTLYELDARLRPMGNKGPLAISLDYFKQYWRQGQLMDWERLALTRARLVAGDESVGERALHLVRSAVYSPLKDTRALAHEAQAMRKRLEENAGKDDLKRGAGGLVDIEFVAQYLQVVHGAALPPLRQPNTVQALKEQMRFGKLNREDGGILLRAYEFLTSMENRVRVVHGFSTHQLPQQAEALRKLALRTGYADAPGRSAA
ncbi:MAG: bifunctional [glutamate--ammonia ligase]-adenylyl-L-tyrosine phosphorylase/[glutamate--ammonia-ligase] adenylyltransferase, partial [Planctomycetota bacterium]